MTWLLTVDELRELTAKRRSDAQRRSLDYMSIPYLVRPDGSLAVLRSHVEAPQSAAPRLPREPELQP
jgi:hypothetical protein